jgi:hypothetical protein
MVFRDDGMLDPDKPVFITLLGKKGQGKSKLARVIFNSYPYDRAILDVNGTDKPDEVDKPETGFHEIDFVPEVWPEDLREGEKPLTLYFKPDAGKDDFQEVQDKFVGLCFRHGSMLLLVHEMGVLARSNRTLPQTRRMLHQGRHRNMSALMCAPRPVTMEPLVIAQSDLVYIFKLPNPKDRRLVADVIGWEPEDLDLAIRELGDHEYLRYDDSEPEDSAMKLVSFDALPESEIAS